MKVMIAGGGTGGHLFPGLALAEEFKKRDAKTEVIFVGTEHGIESKIIPAKGTLCCFCGQRVLWASHHEKNNRCGEDGALVSRCAQDSCCGVA